MRKILSILSITCLLLAVGVVPAKATTYNYPVSFTYNGDTVQGTFTLDTTAKSVSFTGTVKTAAGQTYDILAEGDITGQPPRLTLSGSIVVSLPDGTVVTEITINQTASTYWAAIDDFLLKLLGALPH